jgi:hypothetical protein
MATETHSREQALAASATPVFETRPDSSVMKAALDAISRDAGRTVIKLTKSAARMFLAIDTRWRLNLLWKGLEVMEPDEALAVLERTWHLPSYQTFSRRIDIRGARLTFRWLRFVDSRARCGDTVVVSDLVSPWIRLSRVAAMACHGRRRPPRRRQAAPVMGAVGFSPFAHRVYRISFTALKNTSSSRELRRKPA